MNIPAIITMIAILIPSVFANSEWNSGYNKPIESSKFNFTATLDAGSVKMTWEKFSSFSNETLVYYKVVRSSKNSNPVYPEDGYIKYDSSMDFTSYTDNEPQKWINYYRICAITEKKNRYCSKVVTIKIAEITAENKTEEKVGMANPASVNCKNLGGETIMMKDEKGNQYGKCKLPDGRVCEEWKLYRGECEVKKEEPQKKDDIIMKRVENLIEQFDKKLTEKFWADNATKVKIIETAISRLEALKIQKPSMINIIAPLTERLKQLSTKYTDTSEIESILDIK